jgi:AraC family transcriptional regulator
LIRNNFFSKKVKKQANENTVGCVEGFMSACEQMTKLSSSCPVTDVAGRTIRRRDVAGFSLTEAHYNAGLFLPAHCHSESYLVLVLSGGYTERHSDRDFEWKEGASYLLPASERHENQFTSTVRMLRVRVEPAGVQRLGDDYARYLSEPREISGALASWLSNRLVREFLSQDDIASLAIEGVVLEMLAESARSSGETHESNAPNWLRRVRECLEESYLEAPSLATLAGIAGVHPVHLSRQFHKHFHMTIGEFVRKRRIDKASELLSQSDLSLAEIASACGFSDQSHFCALFKKHSGMTPAKFRNLSGSPRTSDPSPRLVKAAH